MSDQPTFTVVFRVPGGALMASYDVPASRIGEVAGYYGTSLVAVLATDAPAEAIDLFPIEQVQGIVRYGRGFYGGPNG